MANKIVTTVRSTFLSIEKSQLVKTIWTAVIAVVVAALAKILYEHRLPTLPEIKDIGWLASDAGVATFLRLWLSNSQGQFGKGEDAAVEKEATINNQP